MLSPWTQNVNWMYIRHSEDVLCTFNLRPVYRGIFNYYNASSEVMLKSNIHKPLKQISKFEELVKYLKISDILFLDTPKIAF